MDDENLKHTNKPSQYIKDNFTGERRSISSKQKDAYINVKDFASNTGFTINNPTTIDESDKKIDHHIIKDIDKITTKINKHLINDSNDLGLGYKKNDITNESTPDQPVHQYSFSGKALYEENSLLNASNKKKYSTLKDLNV